MKLGKLIPLVCTLLGFANSNNIDPECYYSQVLKPGINYYVLNPEYPDYYSGENSCQWKAKSNTRVHLNCSFVDIPATPNCEVDYLKVYINDNLGYKFCGVNSFVIESKGSTMLIQFKSSRSTQGGKFQCTLKATKEQCKCGWKNPSRIVGGVETGVNEYPMMAGLVDANKKLLFCGATIVSPTHVVTAAHCVEKYVNNTSILGIIVGEHDVKRGDETNATKLVPVSKVTIHPNYSLHYNDIAIVKAKFPFEWSMKVGPVCLPFSRKLQSFEGAVVTALGWGLTDFEGSKPSVLMKVNLDVISNKNCTRFYGPEITPKKICTYTKGKDSCQFDSGGPELWQDPNTDLLNLIGVISYGITCADEDPAVAMRTTAFLDFILDKTTGTCLV